MPQVITLALAINTKGCEFKSSHDVPQ